MLTLLDILWTFRSLVSSTSASIGFKLMRFELVILIGGSGSRGHWQSGQLHRLAFCGRCEHVPESAGERALKTSLHCGTKQLLQNARGSRRSSQVEKAQRKQTMCPFLLTTTNVGIEFEKGFGRIAVCLPAGIIKGVTASLPPNFKSWTKNFQVNQAFDV